MVTIDIPHLSDDDLIAATRIAVGDERHATVQLIRLLAELDARRLYLGQGCSSLFAYCTSVLHLSEHAAYHRIEAARAARQFPAILERLAEGAVTLTGIGLLRPHLTADNHLALLEAARHKSKREIEHLIAALAPKPDVAPLLRRIAVLIPLSATSTAATGPSQPAALAVALDQPGDPPAAERVAPPTIARIESPASADRYLLRMTISGETHSKLQRARDLLRHTVTSGDPAAIVDRALTVLLEHLERSKFSATTRPKPARASSATNRHVPAAVQRVVWARDGGQCTFVGAGGRCAETGRLEFHHVTPYARGGRTDAANLALRCRAHNAYEARLAFGDRQPWLTHAGSG